MVPPELSTRFREETAPEILDEIAAQARDLREWFRTFVTTYAGRRLEASAVADLDKINRLLERDAAYRQVEPRANEARDADDPSFQWRRHRRWRGPEDLLLPIAEAIGRADLPSGLRAGQELRRCDLHIVVPRYQQEPYPPLVQHGGLRQPRQSGRPPRSKTVRTLGKTVRHFAVTCL
jgi:hypothetical protein